MTPETQFSQNLGIRNVLVAMAMLIICVSGNAATPGEQTVYERKSHQLQYYRTAYTKEIYSYCVRKYRSKESKLKRCMKGHDQLKQKILNNALKQLGRHSFVQGIYDECLDYHPYEGVGRIGNCVKTRLRLDSKLEDDTIEKKIYRKCFLKWRKHGSGAIDNCSRNDANYYRRKSQLRD